MYELIFFLLETQIRFDTNRNMPKAVVARPALSSKAGHAHAQLAKLYVEWLL
jgi:hypothetical protein